MRRSRTPGKLFFTETLGDAVSTNALVYLPFHG